MEDVLRRCPPPPEDRPREFAAYAEARLLEAGHSSCHFYGDLRRKQVALSRLARELASRGVPFRETRSTIEVGSAHVLFAALRVSGAAMAHYPLVVMDGKGDRFADPVAVREARMVAATVRGVGPVTLEV